MTDARRRVALCLMAHPDDCEFLAAGTLALLAQRGWQVHIATATPGDCGTTTLGPQAIAALRRQEAAAAAARIGAEYHCLELRDLHVTYGDDAIRRALELCRAIAPTLVLTHALQDYMPDHEETARLARTASLGFFVPNACGGPITPGVGMPYLYYADPIGLTDLVGRPAPAGLVIDIGTVYETKRQMLAAHTSQRDWLRAHYGTDDYLDNMTQWSRQRGHLIGKEYGEGFRQHKGYGYPADCILARELGTLVVTAPPDPNPG
jgi:LmbE family N-acetylglucosaminyl deacetylase